jgi:hypothetical protein
MQLVVGKLFFRKYEAVQVSNTSRSQALQFKHYPRSVVPLLPGLVSRIRVLLLRFQ